jgi:phenylalanyl-tRNA synthetase beta chain
MLVGVWTGARVGASWHAPAVPCDFFDIKGALEGLLQGLKVAAVRFADTPDEQCTYVKPGAAADLWHADEHLGVVGEVHPEVRANWDLKQPIFMFEIVLDRLYPLIPLHEVAQPLSKFPSTSRDITVIVDQGVASGAIVQYLKEQPEALVDNIFLFDVFQGAPIPPDKKSLSLRVTYRSFDATLEDEHVNQIHRALTGKLLAEYKAALPA